MTMTIFHRRHPVSVEIPVPRLGALLAPVDDRIRQIEQAFPHSHVTVDTHFVLGECRWCDPKIPEPSSVRVYGDPEHDERVHEPLLMVEVCIRCALDRLASPILRAAMESKTSADIRVEVSA